MDHLSSSSSPLDALVCSTLSTLSDAGALVGQIMANKYAGKRCASTRGAMSRIVAEIANHMSSVAGDAACKQPLGYKQAVPPNGRRG